jgi:hypothetical protein
LHKILLWDHRSKSKKAQRHEDIFNHEFTRNNGEKENGKRRTEAGGKEKD